MKYQKAKKVIMLACVLFVLFWLAVLLICAAEALVGLVAGARAEDELEEVWILCQEDSYVNIRRSANKKAKPEGRAFCGDSFRTDGKKKNGFLHVYASIEAGEGWIFGGYIVWDRPDRLGGEAWRICSNGRVAARRTVGGTRRKWLRDGEAVKVYWMAEEWSCTSQGFIKTRYLGKEGTEWP